MLLLPPSSMFSKPTLTAFCVSTLCAFASARTELTNGTSGSALEGPGYTTMGSLLWQSSGVLYDGCNNSAEYPINITDCYALQLSSDPTENLESDTSDSPRQRIEFLTAGAADGTSWTYEWKYYLSSQTGTTNHFFHLMQILTRGGTGGPVITLNAAGGQVAIQDTVRGCPAAGCPSIALDDFTDKTTTHKMSVTYGPNGSVAYSIEDFFTGKIMLTYSATGSKGSTSTSLKFGTYRLAVEDMTVSL
ncbi:hypothetical protein B0H11DRAFT_1708963 [Mycena galericulata]|nr:hypothetical protein B0H11DRAFT_1708963 [Mycena galericulata]